MIEVELERTLGPRASLNFIRSRVGVRKNVPRRNDDLLTIDA